MPEPQKYYQRLAGKVAIVTGAGSQGDPVLGVGNGKAIALVFAREGARVALVDIDASRAQATANTIRAANGQVLVIDADVTLADDCARIVAETNKLWGPATILVNNVGIAGGRDSLIDCDLARWQQIMDVNLKSVLLMSAAVIGGMIAMGGGSIVNIGSIAGLRRYGTLAYGPSKAALVALTEEIAFLHGRQGVRANTVAPGHVVTPLSLGLLGQEAREERRKAGPLGVEGDAWDIAAAALFLASDESRFITGTCLPVDGGVIVAGSLAAKSLLND